MIKYHGNNTYCICIKLKLLKRMQRGKKVGHKQQPSYNQPIAETSRSRPKHHTIQSQQRHNQSLNYNNSINISRTFTKKKKFRPFNYNILAEKRIQMQNQRLMKRLGEISHRKNKFKIQNVYGIPDDYVALNTKARKACRKQKQKQIQEQNNSFVERLVHKWSSYKTVNSDNEGIVNKSVSIDKKNREHSIKKFPRNQEVQLPSIYKNNNNTQPLK